MYCKSCGAEINNEAIMCVKCGVPTGAAAKEGKDLTQGEKVGGWLGAFFFPIIGIIVGIVALTRGKVGQGIGMIAVSIFMCFFWAGFFQALGQ